MICQTKLIKLALTINNLLTDVFADHLLPNTQKVSIHQTFPLASYIVNLQV